MEYFWALGLPVLALTAAAFFFSMFPPDDED